MSVNMPGSLQRTFRDISGNVRRMKKKGAALPPETANALLNGGKHAPVVMFIVHPVYAQPL